MNNSFFKTIFLKENSSLEKELESLENQKYSKLEDLKSIRQGIQGEKQVAYQLKKANIGMYVLRDVNLSYEEMTAQIDFVVVTTHHCYFIECKNYYGNISIDEFGNFVLKTKTGKRTQRKGISSPISQADAQLELFTKLCLEYPEKTKEMLRGIRFKDYFKTLVVFANPNTILSMRKAPPEIKKKMIKVDNLIRTIELDGQNQNKKLTPDEMKQLAEYILVFDNNVQESHIISQTMIDKYSWNIDSYNRQNSSVKSNRNTISKTSAIKVIIGIISLLCFSLLIKNNDYISNLLRNDKKNTQERKITENQKNAINTLKTAYNNSKENGFEIIHTNICKELSNIFYKPFDCVRFPLQVKITDNNKISIYKNFTCYNLELSEDSTKISYISQKYIGYNNDKKCGDTAIGVTDWNDNNDYCKKIGGIDKIREMAKYSYVNNTFVHGYYEDHVQERGGTQIYTLYYMNVDMYFSGLTGRGYSISSDTTRDQYEKMCESFYYIMK